MGWQLKRTNFLSNGEALIYFLGVITYLPQFIFHILLDDLYVDYYNFSSGSQFLSLYILAFYISVIMVNRLIPNVRIEFYKYIKLVVVVLYKSKTEFFVAFFGLPLSIYFYFKHGIEFRQSERMSDGGALVLIMYIFQSYMQTWFIYLLYKIKSKKRFESLDRFKAIIYTVCLFLMLTGSLNMIFVVWGVLFSLLSGKYILKQIFKSKTIISLMFEYQTFFKLSLLVLLLSLIVSIGFINKNGYEGALDKLEVQGVHILEYLIIRLSSSYASVISFAQNHMYDLEMYKTVWSITPENFLYRFSKIIPLEGELLRPELTQINRLNYLNYVLDNQLDHAGASPGIVATGFYLAPFPFGYIVAVLYCVLFIRVWGSIISSIVEKMNLVTILFFSTMSFGMLESPMDYLLIIEPSVFYLLFIISIFITVREGR